MEEADVKVLRAAGFESREGFEGAFRRRIELGIDDPKGVPYTFQYIRWWPAFGRQPGYWIASYYTPNWQSPRFDTAAACLLYAEAAGWKD